MELFEMELFKEVSYKLLTGPDRYPQRPIRTYHGDAGFDLYVSRAIVIEPGCFEDVHTDIAVELPGGMWGRITGRSSTWRKRGLIVQEGVIDNGYRGELWLGVYNPGNYRVAIQAGERVAQLILQPILAPTWIEVEALNETDRRERGFGSTGV